LEEPYCKKIFWLGIKEGLVPAWICLFQGKGVKLPGAEGIINWQGIQSFCIDFQLDEPN